MDLWSGPYVITEREDVVDATTFDTNITVYFEGSDPLNTREKLTQEQIDARRKKEIADIEEARKKAEARRKARRKAGKKTVTTSNDATTSNTVPKANTGGAK